MRRDLNRGCAICRLRFSSQLTHCPVCRSAPLAVDQAIRQVQPTSRITWLVKWAIVLPCVPALGFILMAGHKLLKEGWPPQNAVDVVTYGLGALGTALGASIMVAVVLSIWSTLIALIGGILRLIVDRPRRSLRISIEMQQRPIELNDVHAMHRLWRQFNDFVDRVRDNPKPLGALFFAFYLGSQLLAEIFGKSPVLNFTNWELFKGSVVTILIINGMSFLAVPLFWIVFGVFGRMGLSFLNKPPNLFGYDPNPPKLMNQDFLEMISENRPTIIGTVVPLDPREKEALGHPTKDELIAPGSGKACFGFRIIGDADGQPVDDADVTSFALIADDQKRYVVDVRDVVVKMPAKKKIRADAMPGFLQERGLPKTDLSLKEGRLEQGARVRVHGRTNDLRVGSAGYRGDERRGLIDAGDGLPVLIQAVEEAPT